jgi:transposase
MLNPPGQTPCSDLGVYESKINRRILEILSVKLRTKLNWHRIVHGRISVRVAIKFRVTSNFETWPRLWSSGM